MRKVEATYAFIRLLEEENGSLSMPGDVLIYRSVSRFPWIDLIFDLEPGTRCTITSADYDSADQEPDYDPWDNHFHYVLEGLEEHGGLTTTEIISMFDLEMCPAIFDSTAKWVKSQIDDYRTWLKTQPFAGDRQVPVNS